MRKDFLLLCLIAFFSINTFAQPIGYNFGKQIAIPSSSVSGSVDLSNFPLLISITDSDLRTVANSGNVSNANGFDIVFTQSDCSTLLDHQIEKYDPVTGEYVVWVRVPILSASRRTDIHMYYGNSSISIDPSTTSTWSSNYAAVWHMNQSPVTTAPQLIDYTVNNNNGTANGTMLASDLVVGKIGNSINFDGSNDFFDCGSSSSVHPTGDLTVSAWINADATNGHIINCGGGWDDPGYSLFHLSNRIRIELQRTGEKDIIDNNIAVDGNWHFVALTYNNATGLTRCFIDGAFQTSTGVHTGPIGTPIENLNIGRKEQNNFYFNGLIDEGRVILENKSFDWLLTEYNNQNNPSTFYSIGSEETASDLCAIALDVELNYFEVECLESEVLLKWQTLSETNNNYFTIERSLDAQNWEYLTEVKGAGNSINPIQYKVIDKSPKAGLFYYKLTQTDFDGVTSEDILRTVNCEKIENSPLKLYPNPSTNYLIIESQNQPVKIYTISGKELTSIIPQILDSNSKVVLSTENLSKGLYIIKTNEGQARFIKN